MKEQTQKQEKSLLRKIGEATLTIILNFIFFGIIYYALFGAPGQYKEWAENITLFYIPVSMALVFLVSIMKHSTNPDIKFKQPERSAGTLLPVTLDIIIMIMFAMEGWVGYGIMQLLIIIFEADVFTKES